MTEPIIQRFALSDSAPDLTGSGVHEYHSKPYGSVWLTRIHGYQGVVLDLANRQDLKDDHGFELQGGLATPAAKHSKKMKDTLQAENITLAPGDDLLNALRALRDKYDKVSPNPFGFDISHAS